MRCFTCGWLCVIPAALALALFVSSDVEAAKKAKKAKAVKGTVTEISKDSFTLKIPATPAKGKKPAQEASEKKFKVDDATKFTEITGKKQTSPVTRDEAVKMAKDKVVTVLSTGDTATEVKIGKAKKKAKKAKAQ